MKLLQAISVALQVILMLRLVCGQSAPIICTASDPNNGTVVVELVTAGNGAQYSFATYECDLGYYIDSQFNTRACISSGSWNLDPPNCMKSTDPNHLFQEVFLPAEIGSQSQISISYSGTTRQACWITVSRYFHCTNIHEGVYAVPDLRTEVLTISTAEDVACLIEADTGTLVCFGESSFNVLKGISFHSVDTSRNHVCGVKWDFRIYCTELCISSQSCDYGQIITDDEFEYYVADFCVHQTITCVVSSLENYLECFGGSFSWDSGEYLPEMVFSDDVKLSCGQDSVCVITADTSVTCVYKDSAGSIVTYTAALPPWAKAVNTVSIASPNTPYDDWGLGANQYICALDNDQHVFCWNHLDGNTTVQWQASAPTDCRHLVADVRGACCVTDNYILQCWDRPNDTYITQPGIGAYPIPVLSTSLDIFTVPHVVDVSPSLQYVCYLLDTLTIQCVESISFEPDPALLAPPDGEFTSIYCSTEMACAVAKTGYLSCWGHNDAQTSYWPDSNSDFFIAVHTNHGEVCGILNTGDAKCWWRNSTSTISAPGPPTVIFTQLFMPYVGITCGWLNNGMVSCFNDPAANSDSSSYFNTVRPPGGTVYSAVLGYRESMCVQVDGESQITCYPNVSRSSTDADSSVLTDVLLPDDLENFPPSSLATFAWTPSESVGDNSIVCAAPQRDEYGHYLWCDAAPGVRNSVLVPTLYGFHTLKVGKDSVCVLNFGGLRCFGGVEISLGGAASLFSDRVTNFLIISDSSQDPSAADVPWCGSIVWSSPCASISYAISRPKTSLISDVLGPFMYTYFFMNNGTHQLTESAIMEQIGSTLQGESSDSAIISTQYWSITVACDLCSIKFVAFTDFLDASPLTAALRIESEYSVYLRYLLFQNNERALLIKSDAQVDIDSCMFSDNSGSVPGVAIRSFFSSVEIYHSEFLDNSGGEGGAINNLGGKLTLWSNSFTGNRGTSGGAVYSDYGSVQINDVEFISNEATQSHGGAIYIVSSEDSVSIENTVFYDNKAAVGGGAIRFEDNDFSMDNCELKRNKADDGGALEYSCSTTNSSTGIIRTNTFFGNQAYRFGGASWIENCDVTITDASVFDSNSAGDAGGAIFASSATVTIEGELVNVTEGDGGGGGGGGGPAGPPVGRRLLAFQPSYISFTNNSAVSGGGIFVLTGSLTLEYVWLSDNEALDELGDHTLLDRSNYTEGAAVVATGSFDGSVSGYPVSINVLTDPSSTQQTAGTDFAPNFIFELLDEFGQRSAYNAYVELNLVGLIGELTGIEEVLVRGGVGSFNRTGVAAGMKGPPGNYTMFLSTEYISVDGSTLPINSDAFEITLRPCYAGEEYSPDAQACLNCEAGHYGLGYQSSCEACPAGSYSEDRAGSCISCPAGSYAQVSGQSSCLDCEIETFSLNSGAIACQSCPWTSASCSSAGIKVEGGAWLSEYDTSSIKAAQDANNASLLIRLANDKVEVVPCPPAICLQDNACADHRLPYEYNILCGKCEDGYSEWGSACVKCEDTNWGFAFLLVFLCFGYVLFLMRVSRATTGMTKVLVYFLQTSLFMIGSVSTILDWMGIFNLDPQGSGYCVTPISSYAAFGLKLSMPLIFAVALIIIMIIHFGIFSCLYPDESFGQHKIMYYRTGTSLLLFSYTHLTTNALYFLQCLDVGDESVVYSRPSLSCNDSEYKAWYPVIILIIVCYTFALPLAIYLTLRKYKDRIGTTANHNSEFYRRWGILYEMYKPEQFYYEAFATFRRTILISFDVVLYLDTSGRHLSFMFINFIFLSIHSILQPFRIQIENLAETVSLVVLTFISFVLGAYPPPLDSGVDVVLSILVLVPGLFLIISFLILKYYKYQHKKRMKLGTMDEIGRGDDIDPRTSSFKAFFTDSPAPGKQKQTIGAASDQSKESVKMNTLVLGKEEKEKEKQKKKAKLERKITLFDGMIETMNNMMNDFENDQDVSDINELETLKPSTKKDEGLKYTTVPEHADGDIGSV